MVLCNGGGGGTNGKNPKKSILSEKIYAFHAIVKIWHVFSDVEFQLPDSTIAFDFADISDTDFPKLSVNFLVLPALDAVCLLYDLLPVSNDVFRRCLFDF